MPDTLEIVLRRDAGVEPGAATPGATPPRRPRRRSQHWRAAPGDGDAYAAYRAAQDREDAAQDALGSDPDVPDQRLVAAVGGRRLGARLAAFLACAA